MFSTTQITHDYQKAKILNKFNEYLENANQGIHGSMKLFKTAYEMGEPIFTEEIKTAAVQMNNADNKIKYLFNPMFWLSLNEDERCFVIAHESLHIFFNHLDLIKEFNLNPYIANIATDIVINETLIHGYGFNPYLPIISDKALTIKSVFNETQIIENELNYTSGFMKFYSVIEKLSQKDKNFQESLSQKDTLDNHDYQQNNQEENNNDSFASANNEEESNNQQNNQKKDNNQQNNQEENNNQQNNQKNNSNQQNSQEENNNQQNNQEECNNQQNNQATDNNPSNNENHQKQNNNDETQQKSLSDMTFIFGGNLKQNIENDLKENTELPSVFQFTDESNDFNQQQDLLKIIANGSNQKPLMTWEKLLNFSTPNLLSRNTKPKGKEYDNFAEKDYALQLALPKKIILPSIAKTEQSENDRFDLYFFFDTSGSCYPYRNAFAKMIGNIPLKQYRLHLFNFDTNVKKIEFETKGKYVNIENFKYKHANSNSSLNMIEKQIQNDLKNKIIKEYPPFVCVLTDGIAPPLSINVLKNEHIQNWIFLLISDNEIEFNKLKQILNQLTNQQNMKFHKYNFNMANELIQNIQKIQSENSDNKIIEMKIEKHWKTLHKKYKKQKNNLIKEIKVIPSYLLGFKKK